MEIGRRVNFVISASVSEETSTFRCDDRGSLILSDRKASKSSMAIIVESIWRFSQVSLMVITNGVGMEEVVQFASFVFDTSYI